MGSASVIIWSTIIVILIVLLLAMIQRGGPPIPPQALEAQDWGLSPVASIDCLGFRGGENLLNNQVYFTSVKDAEGNWAMQAHKNELPPLTYQHESPSNPGALVDGYQVAIVGGVAYDRISTGPDGQETTTPISPPKGTAQDCCAYLRQNGTMGAAVFDQDTEACYVLDYMQPYNGTDNFLDPATEGDTAAPTTRDDVKTADIANVFPLLGPHALVNVGDMGTGQQGGKYVYMMACGGQGMPPCNDVQNAGKRVARDFTSSWPPSKNGCSQTGGKDPPMNGKPTIDLYRTPARTGLPFSDDEQWELCETMPYILNMGYHPKEPDKCKETGVCLNNPALWEWSGGFPRFDPTDPKTTGEYDPNTSLARFLMPQPLQKQDV